MKKIGLYEVSVITCFALLPILAVIVDIFILRSQVNVFGVMYKWFVFSGVGLRLFTAGLKQVTNPSFTAKEIFKTSEEKSFLIVKEVGLANISIGLVGILSLFFSEFRLAVSIVGGLYFGLAGCLHLFNNVRSREEIFPMISDFYIFFVLLILTIINCINDNVIT